MAKQITGEINPSEWAFKDHSWAGQAYFTRPRKFGLFQTVIKARSYYDEETLTFKPQLAKIENCSASWRELTLRGKVAAAVAGVTGLAGLIAGGLYYSTTIPPQSRADKLAQYAKSMSDATQDQRFEAEYITAAVDLGRRCLSGEAFDTTPQSVVVREGLGESAKDVVYRRAAAASIKPDVETPASAFKVLASNGDVLSFRITSNTLPLSPADMQTRNTLVHGYGCEDVPPVAPGN